jgi:integral membrane protein
VTAPAARRGGLFDFGPGLAGPLQRYRWMAWITGTMLLILTVGVIVQLTGGGKGIVAIAGPIHGVLFLVYLVVGLEMCGRARFSLVRSVLILAAGVIPGLSFVMERKVSAELAARHAG